MHTKKGIEGNGNKDPLIHNRGVRWDEFSASSFGRFIPGNTASVNHWIGS